MFARVFMCVSGGERKSELDREKEQAPAGLDDRMFHKHDCYRRCLALSGKGNLTGIITIPPPSAEGRCSAHTSELISLSSFSAFLSQDKHMPEYDLLPCLSGCDTHTPLTHLFVFCVFDGMFVCPPGCGLFFCSTSLAETLLGCGFVYLIGMQ